MTQEAYDLFGRALSEQHARNEARRIRIRVHEARGNPHPASFRWPFELLQIALDSGPRSGSSTEPMPRWQWGGRNDQRRKLVPLQLREPLSRPRVSRNLPTRTTKLQHLGQQGLRGA